MRESNQKIFVENERFNPKKSLKCFDTGIDELGRQQLFAAAVTVFLHKEGKTLLMKQTKDHRVVGDNYVGLGGKSLLNTYFGEEIGEKIPTEVVISSLYAGEFGIKGTLEENAVKEVFEETEEIIKLKEEKLVSIGDAQVKVLNEKNNEIWQISYFSYELDGSEGDLVKMSCSEGNFEWVDDDKLLDKRMLPADKIILQNQDPNLLVEAVYDDLNDIHQLRTESVDLDGRKSCVLTPDYNNPEEYIKEID